MALQSSGPISLNDIATEFGGSTPHSLNEYYGAATGVPSSGAIDFADFYGKSDNVVLPYNETKVTAFDAAAGDQFGTRVAVGNGRIVVGAYGDDDAGSNSGSAYIYNTSGGLIGKVTASDADASDIFGRSVAVGSNKIVIGARDDEGGGSAYIYDLNGGSQIKIVASDRVNSDEYGASVAVGNNVIVVGAPNADPDALSDSGAAYIYNLSGGNEIKITGSNPAAFAEFGAAVAVGQDASHQMIVVGAERNEMVYAYDLAGNELFAKRNPDWTGVSGNFFGNAVAIGEGRIAVGAYGDNGKAGAVYLYDLSGNFLKKIVADDTTSNRWFGASVALGNNMLITGSYGDDTSGGGSFSGSFYTFNLLGNQKQKTYASVPVASSFFGNSAALGSNKAVIGANGGNGAIYLYDVV